MGSRLSWRRVEECDDATRIVRRYELTRRVGDIKLVLYRRAEGSLSRQWDVIVLHCHLTQCWHGQLLSIRTVYVLSLPTVCTINPRIITGYNSWKEFSSERSGNSWQTAFWSSVIRRGTDFTATWCVFNFAVKISQQDPTNTYSTLFGKLPNGQTSICAHRALINKWRYLRPENGVLISWSVRT